jgi:DNA-binding GntR family transcriptional regulator
MLMARADHAPAATAAGHFAESLSHGEVASLGQANQRLHLALYRPARRPQTLEDYQRLHQQCDRLLRLQLTLTDGGAQAVREHADIAEAVQCGDADTAAHLIHTHILGAGQRLVRALDARYPSGAAS